MSVNRYNASTGELENIASGQRTWVGTQAAYKAAKQAGTLPNNAIIAITDDEQDYNHYSTDETFTGMYWIDGKKIYRRVFELGNITDPGKTVSLPGYEKIVKFYVDRQYDSRTSYRVSGSGTSIDINTLIYGLGTDQITIMAPSSGHTTYDVFVILEYTKTTD